MRALQETTPQSSESAARPEPAANGYHVELLEVSGGKNIGPLRDRLTGSLQAAGLEYDELTVSAVELASELHATHNTRRHGPLLRRCLRNSVRLIENFEIKDPETISTSLLSDSLAHGAYDLARTGEERIGNDVPVVKVREMAASKLSDRLNNSTTVEVIKQLTPEYEPSGTLETIKASRLAHTEKIIEEGHPRARAIILSGFIDQIIQNDYNYSKAKGLRYKDDELTALFPLYFRGLHLPDGLLQDEKRDEINELLVYHKGQTERRIGAAALNGSV